MGKQERGFGRLLAVVLGQTLLAVAASAGAGELKLADGPAADAPATAELLGLRQLGAADGLPQLTVFALAQDASGQVYAGTQDGLARWDGRRFTSLPLPAGRHDWVTHLQAGADGLWIGTDSSGLLLQFDGTIREVRDDAGRSLPSIEAIGAAARGGAWIGTPAGLFHCTAQACRAISGSADLEIAELQEDAAGRLWVGTNVDGLYRFDVRADGELERSVFHLGKADGLPNDAVRALLFDQRQRLWIGTGRGLARLDGDTLMRWQSAGNGPLGGVFGLQSLPDGSLLAALWGSGLGQFRMDDSYRVFGLADGLPDSYLQTLMVSTDASDSIVWLGSGSSGILRLEDGLWRSFDERHGLPQRVVVGVGMLALGNGPEELWAGTLGGAVRWHAGRWTPLLPSPYADYVVYDALRDPLGQVWLGTQRGVLRLTNGSWRAFTVEGDDLPATSVEHLLWANDRLWLGTSHGLATIVGDRVERQFADQPAFADIAVSSMTAINVPEHGLRIALGTSRGVLLTADGATVQTLPPACRRHGQTYDIEPLSNGEVWLATRAGAVRLRWIDGKAACTPVSEPDGPARTVYEIIEDRRGRVYLFGYDGARRIDANTTDPTSVAASYRVFGLDDGLPALEFNRDALVDAHGRIWAANAGGLAMFDAADETPVPASPHLVLEAHHGSDVLAIGARLAPDHGEIAFTPRLLSFRHEHRIRYRDQLIGLDPQPSAWQADGDRRYPRIPPGDYQFMVEAMDAAGHVHGPAQFDFTIVAPWWQHPLALIAAALALLAAGQFAGRVRARALAARAARLESLVAERTQALERASNSDPLTGAWNRRYFYARIGDWLRQNEPRGGLLLLLVDIDHFKQINDQFGHAAGDAVLVEIAERLRQVEGERSQLIRWGGEEFLLVLARADDDVATTRVLAVLESIAARPIAVGDQSLVVSCSIGYTRCRPPAEGIDSHIDLVIQRADAALYHAKNTGRNRAVEAVAGNDGPQFVAV